MHTHGPAVPRAGTRLCGRGRETTDHRRPRQDTQDGGGQWEVRPGRCAGTGVALPGARDGPQRPVPKHAANLTKAPPPELRARGRPRARSVCPRKIVVPSRRELSVRPLGGAAPRSLLVGELPPRGSSGCRRKTALARLEARLGLAPRGSAEDGRCGRQRRSRPGRRRGWPGSPSTKETLSAPPRLRGPEPSPWKTSGEVKDTASAEPKCEDDPPSHGENQQKDELEQSPVEGLPLSSTGLR